KGYQAILKAQAAGTNFYVNATVQMALGKTFAQAALGASHTPVTLQPFSLSSREVPGAEGHATADEIKRAAITSQPGRVSQFQETEDGGFVLYVQSLLPADEKVKTAEFPRYLAQLRQGREQEAFNLWLQNEFTREYQHNIPNFDEIVGRKPAPRGQ